MAKIDSICVFAGASNAADPAFLKSGADFGRILAGADVRLVYGGGRVGIMGATAVACHDAGGRVLGIIPEFLRMAEVIYDDVETIVVGSMHERKRMMFDESDAFVVLPGGVGTLEEIVEIMSWRRLSLHVKPIVFLDQGGYWQKLFDLFQHTVDAKLTPPAFLDTWRSVERAEDLLDAVQAMGAGPAAPGIELVT